MQHYDRINGVLGRRTMRQFGFTLTDEETITQGLGIREGHTVGEGGYDFLPPTTVYTCLLYTSHDDTLPAFFPFPGQQDHAC